MNAAFGLLDLFLAVAAVLATFVAVAWLVYLGYAPFAQWTGARIFRYADWMVRELDTQFVFVNRGRARLFVAAALLVGAVLGFVLSRSIVFTIVTSALGGALPRWIVLWMRRRRIRKFAGQLPDALRMASNGMKAGFSLPQALDLVAKEMPPPTKDEIGLVLREHSVGAPIDEAIENLGRRMPIDDVRILVTSITTLRETGGNITEAFDTIVNTILDRKKVEDKIEAVTAEGVFQGYVLCAFPAGLALAFYYIDPNFIRPLFTTILGWIMLSVALVLELTGLWFIRKVVTIDV